MTWVWYFKAILSGSPFHCSKKKKKKKNTETPKISGIKASGIALISAISEAYLFNSFLDYIRYSNILLIN